MAFALVKGNQWRCLQPTPIRASFFVISCQIPPHQTQSQRQPSHQLANTLRTHSVVRPLSTPRLQQRHSILKRQRSQVLPASHRIFTRPARNQHPTLVAYIEQRPQIIHLFRAIQQQQHTPPRQRPLRSLFERRFQLLPKTPRHMLQRQRNLITSIKSMKKYPIREPFRRPITTSQRPHSFGSQGTLPHPPRPTHRRHLPRLQITQQLRQLIFTVLKIIHPRRPLQRNARLRRFMNMLLNPHIPPRRHPLYLNRRPSRPPTRRANPCSSRTPQLHIRLHLHSPHIHPPPRLIHRRQPTTPALNTLSLNPRPLRHHLTHTHRIHIHSGSPI